MLKVGSYRNNDRLYIEVIMASDGEPFGNITINLSDLPIRNNDEGFLDDITNSNMFDIIPVMKELGIIKKSYGKRKYNYGSYEYVKFDLEKLKEYDKDGVENYLSLYYDLDHNMKI